MHEEADLVASRRRHARREVAARDGSGTLHQQLDRRDQAPREEERAVDGRQQRDQEHETQRQREAVLQRRAQIRELLHLVVAALHGVRERADPLLQRKFRLHEAELVVRAGNVKAAAARI